MKGKALGRGLSALIPGAESEDKGRLNLPLDILIENPFQPREKIEPESLRELIDSIKEKGVIQPIAVCKRDNDYLVIAGARRLKAARLAGLRTIPSTLIEIKSDSELLELALVENLQREDLNPMELALGYQRLTEECNLTQEEVAKKVGKQRPTVTNTLRLLKLPEIIQNGLREGKISAGHAKALTSLEDPDLQIKLFRRTVKEGLNVRKLERLTQKPDSLKRKAKAEPEKTPYIADLENRLRAQLATKLKISPRGKGGIIEISYFSEAELERLVEMLESAGEAEIS